MLASIRAGTRKVLPRLEKAIPATAVVIKAKATRRAAHHQLIEHLLTGWPTLVIEAGVSESSAQ